MGEKLELRLKSPVGAEPAVYPWPLPVYVSVLAENAGVGVVGGRGRRGGGGGAVGGVGPPRAGPRRGGGGGAWAVRARRLPLP